MYSHGAVAAKYFGREAVEAIFNDYTQTSTTIRKEARLACGMLKTLTHSPQTFGANDIRPLLEAGVQPTAVEHSLLVGGYLFNMHNRLIDALGCDIPLDKTEQAAQMLNQVGRKPSTDGLKDGQAVAFAGKIPKTIQAWIEVLEHGEGMADPMLRTAVMNRVAHWTGSLPKEVQPIPSVIADYADTIARNAVEVTDEHIVAMKQAGYSELAIFEITFAASTGAGVARLEIGWQALAEAAA